MSKTLVFPLADELADANYLDYLVVCVDMEAATLTRKEIAKVVQTVNMWEHDDDENGDINTVTFQSAVTKALNDAGYTIVFMDIAKLAWPGVG